MAKRVTYTETVAAPPAQVWKILADVTRLPDWAYKEGRFPYPTEGKHGSDQTEGEGAIWIGVAADGQVATQKIIAWQPPHKLAYELQESEHAPLQMAQTNTFELEGDGETTQITWTVDWELTGGFSLGSLLARFTAGGAFEEMMAGSLENLKQLVEQEAVNAEAGEAESAAGEDGESLEEG